MIVAALVIVFCCGCWGFDIKKSPRCVGRLSAVEQNCFTSNYPTISFLEFCQIKIKNVCQIIFLFYRLLVIIHNFQVDAVEFVKDSDSSQLCFTCWIKIKKVIEVNNNSVLHCRTNALSCAMKVMIISIFPYGCVWIIIILGFSQLLYNVFK